MHWFAAVLFVPSALNEAPDPDLFRRGVAALRDRQYSQPAELFLPPETQPAKPPAASAAESELDELLATAPADGAALNVLALLPVQPQRTTGAQSLSRRAPTIATHLAGPLGKLPRISGAEGAREAELRPAPKIGPDLVIAPDGLRSMKKAAASDAVRVGASSLELQPEQTESRLQKNGEMDLRNLDGARWEFALVLRREPRHAGAHTTISVIDYPSADCEAAREKFVRSAVTEPCCQRPHYFYGLTLTKPGNKARAEPELEIAPALQQRRSMPAAVLSGGNP